MNDVQLKASLLDVERQGWDSLCDSTGADFYGELMTDDGVMVLANGAVMDRAAVVESLRQAPPWSSFEIDDVRLVRTGADGAALVYLGTAYRDAEQPAFVGLMSSVYRLVEDQWRLALYQQTERPSKA
jgi:hypothetical protein